VCLICAFNSETQVRATHLEIEIKHKTKTNQLTWTRCQHCPKIGTEAIYLCNKASRAQHNPTFAEPQTPPRSCGDRTNRI
jgi:hypothetical protein